MKPLHIGAHVLSAPEKHILDVVSVGTMVAAFTQYLPSVAAALTIIWTGLRIWESPTVQGWFDKTKKD